MGLRAIIAEYGRPIPVSINLIALVSTCFAQIAILDSHTNRIAVTYGKCSVFSLIQYFYKEECIIFTMAMLFQQVFKDLIYLQCL